jgi:hypothetical protein
MTVTEQPGENRSPAFDGQPDLMHYGAVVKETRLSRPELGGVEHQPQLKDGRVRMRFKPALPSNEMDIPLRFTVDAEVHLLPGGRRG